MSAAWSSWLDQLEASVTAQRAALAAGRSCDAPVGEPPSGLGPLPASLEARARALLQVNGALTAELAAACASVRRQLQLVGAVSPRTGGAAFLDARG